MQILTRKILDAKKCGSFLWLIGYTRSPLLARSVWENTSYSPSCTFHCKSGYVYDTSASVCTGQTWRARFLLYPIIQSCERWNRSLRVSRRDINEIDSEVTLTEMLHVSTRLVESTSLLSVFARVSRACWENFPQRSALLIFHGFICRFMYNLSILVSEITGKLTTSRQLT